jgi:GTP-binding protein Era
VGMPNVGKSTLLNVLLGQKIAIVSARPQTTRNRILGVRNLDKAQVIFIDTPGIHTPKNLLGQAMMRSARQVMEEIDLVVLVTAADSPVKQDGALIGYLGKVEKPVFLVINKVDLVRPPEILPLIDAYRKLFPFREIIPVSALKREGVDLLLEKILSCLPEGPKYYPEEIVTDQVERFMAAEIIREKIMGKTSEEVPYAVAVEVLNWDEREDGLVSIGANIYVEREGQKGIIIGQKGKMLKTIGTLARRDIERLLGTRVFLQLWVKVKKGWRDDRKALNELGY